MHYFVSMPFYPQNSVQPQCRTRSKPNLNIIFVLIIVTDAQVFESVKKYGGQGYLAAPYLLIVSKFQYRHSLTLITKKTDALCWLRADTRPETQYQYQDNTRLFIQSAVTEDNWVKMTQATRDTASVRGLLSAA